MNTYWIIHMKSGRRRDFGNRCHYIHILEEGVLYAMTEKHGRILAIIPLDNILWCESVEEDENRDA